MVAMVKMIATSELEYPPGNVLTPGDPFEAEEGHDKLLETLGRAKLKAQKSEENVAAGSASSSTESESATAKPRPKLALKPRPQQTLAT